MNKLLLAKILIVAAMFGLGLYFYDSLPDKMPIHWNFQGKADNFGPKSQAVFLFPGIALFIIVLFHFLPKLDPKKENYPKFEKSWEIFQFAILGFFAYIFAVSIFITLTPDYNMSKYMMTGIGVLFVILGNYMGKIRQNYFIGIKVPWTLANEEVWNKTHRLGGKLFMLVGLLFFINGFFLFESLPIFIILLSLILIVPIAYSYIIFKKIEKGSRI